MELHWLDSKEDTLKTKKERKKGGAGVAEIKEFHGQKKPYILNSILSLPGKTVGWLVCLSFGVFQRRLF